MPLISKKPFFIFVSQSGETADVISVIKKCKEANIPSLALTNSPLSSIDNLADSVIHLLAGKEISVASTKAYIAQVVTFSILARAVSMKKTNLRTNLNNLALAVENIFASKDLINTTINPSSTMQFLLKFKLNNPNNDVLTEVIGGHYNFILDFVQDTGV